MKYILISILAVLVVGNICQLIFLQDRHMFHPPRDHLLVKEFVSEKGEASKAYEYLEMFLDREDAQYRHYQSVKKFVSIFPSLNIFLAFSAIFFVTRSQISRKLNQAVEPLGRRESSGKEVS